MSNNCKSRKHGRKRLIERFSLFIWLIIFVFIILLVSIVIAGAAWQFVMTLGFLQPFGPGHDSINSLLFILLFSLLVGTSLAAIGGRFLLRPLRQMTEATKEIAAGNFNVHVEVKGTRELERLAASFNEMAGELNNIETLRTDFVSNISHEFKTPLTSIKGFVMLMSKKDLPDEQRAEYQSIIISEIERLSRLSSNVLLLTKLEATGYTTPQSEYALDEQIRRSVILFESQLQKKQLKTVIELEEANISANEEMLRHLWINIIENAVKHSPEGGTIEVRLKAAPENVIVSITDQGKGMDEHVKRRIFEKFYQGDRSRAAEGNGLGLALVKKILELENGTIEVESQPDKGACFTVTLPFTQYPIK